MEAVRITAGVGIQLWDKKVRQDAEGFLFHTHSGGSVARRDCGHRDVFPGTACGGISERSRGGGDRRGGAPGPACGAVLSADDGLREHDVSEHLEKRQGDVACHVAESYVL